MGLVNAFRSRVVGAGLAIVLALCVAALGAGEARAVPGNDDFPGTTIGALPYEASVDTTGATLEPDEPVDLLCGPEESTVWWSFTPTEAGTYIVSVESDGTWIPWIVVWRASQSPAGGLVELTCGVDALLGESGSRANFAAAQGNTYYIQVGGYGGFGEPVEGPVTVSLEKAVPPANNDFADAVPVGSLPFNHDVDFTGATVETNEPQSPCVNDPDLGIEFGTTVWYSYTATESGHVLIDLLLSDAFPVAVVWTGAPGNLTEVACGLLMEFEAVAGETYYIQIGEWYSADFPLVGGMVKLHMERFEVPVCPAVSQTFADPLGDTTDLGSIPLASRRSAGMDAARSKGLPPAAGASPAGVEFADADVTSLAAASGTEAACLTLTFADSIGQAETLEELILIELLIDVDRNPNTGLGVEPDPEAACGSQGPLGAEVGVVADNLAAGIVPVYELGPIPFGGSGASYAVVTLGEDSITVALPIEAIGDGNFDVISGAFGWVNFDCVPNAGKLTVTGPVTPDFGDANCDGSVGGGDVAALLRYLAGAEPLAGPACPQLGQPLPYAYPVGEAPQMLAGDVDCDGGVTPLDALALLRSQEGLDVAQADACPEIGAPALG